MRYDVLDIGAIPGIKSIKNSTFFSGATLVILPETLQGILSLLKYFQIYYQPLVHSQKQLEIPDILVLIIS